jgi:hypothetical protein
MFILMKGCQSITQNLFQNKHKTTDCYILICRTCVTHAIFKNVVRTGVMNVSTLNVNMSKLLTHTLAKINYSLGVGSSIYCEVANKNKFEVSGF